VKRRPPPRATLEAQHAFKQAFGYRAAFTVSAPAVIELLGHHAEAHEGLALMAAIGRFVQMAASPRPDGKIELACAGHSGTECFWLSELKFNPAASWADPIKAVLMELRRHGVPFRGFNLAVHDGIPAHAGLGEVAAWQAAAALMVRKLYPFRLTDTGCLNRPPARDRYGQVPPPAQPERLALAHMTHRASRCLTGVRSSLVEHLTVFCGRAYHALTVDCRHHSVETLPLLGQAALVICPSGVQGEDSAAQVQVRERAGHSAAQKLRARSLRAVNWAVLKEGRMRLNDMEFACAYHQVGETARVVFAERALREGDFLQFGQYLTQSHESARDFLQISCPEADWLVEQALAQPGCLGARLAGPGFGGTTVNLVTWNQYEAFVKKMAALYERYTGRRIQPLACPVVDGVE
jgi:galactokinase